MKAFAWISFEETFDEAFIRFQVPTAFNDIAKNFQRSFQESFKSDFIEAFKGTLLELLLNILTELVRERTNA